MIMPSQISMRDCDKWKIVLTCDLYRWIVISVRLPELFKTCFASFH